MLFADAETCPSLVLALCALAGTVVTVIGTTVGIYLTVRLNGRTGILEHRADTCEKDRAECKEELAQAKAEAAARDDADRAALERKIDALEIQVAGKKDETDGHKPA